jgi:hypothetical protein
MHYTPMHAPLNPNRLVIVFIYLGAAVESLTAAGAAMQGTTRGVEEDLDQYRLGGNLISISVSIFSNGIGM